MQDGGSFFGYAKVRDGVLDHHPRMSFAMIAVFHHLLNRANRTSRRGVVGLCRGLTGNRIAVDMGKSRDSIQRALGRLEELGYITRTLQGIIVHKFATPAGKQATGLKDGRPENRPEPAGFQASGGRKTGQSRPDFRPPNRSTGDDLLRETIFVRPEAAPDPIPETTPVAYWDSALQRVVLDEDWLRVELAPLQAESKTHLTRDDYESELEQLRLAVIADPRLRASIRKADGKPSSPSQFRRFASYTSGWFKRAIRNKARNAKGRASPNAQRKAKTDEALREVMREVLEEEAVGEKK